MFHREWQSLSNKVIFSLINNLINTHNNTASVNLKSKSKSVTRNDL